MGDVVDLTGLGEEFRRDPYPVYARLRERGPVHRVRLMGTYGLWEPWLIVGYEEARAALADSRLVKDQRGIGDDTEEVLLGRHLLGTDPPEHTRLRALVTRAFTARRVQSLAPRIQQITDALLDEMIPRGRADLVDALSYPLPITVICELLGVPEPDRAAFRAMSTEAVAPSGPDAGPEAFARLGAYLTELIEDKRSARPTDDLLSDLIRVTAEDGDRLSAGELRGMAFLLLIAGHETTANLITNAVHTLLTQPAHLTALRADPGLLDGVIEETLRWEGPVENATFRYAAQPLEIGGVALEQGDHVLIGLAAPDRDPARYPDPDRFDPRRDTRGHLAFGHGIHYCLGAPLARLEARTALTSLLERAPGLAPDGPPGEWLPGLLIRGVRSLPVRW
ncbi:cytochrome P450 [Streptomyces roseirectus]|uniref:Cytochrome P450 n=1 Tax=Streptomyces roseirectus TaxID=2768066 RepID=A0A7H0I9A3_9ACTN|nr:cytochrome P450 [Streptomyces roseirectus]QNP69369.1 cytochrome P450 [Streptomyces roseirectus]